MTEMNKDILVSEFQKVGGAWYAEIFEEHLTYQTSKSAVAEDKFVTIISDISANPRARGNEFKFTTAIPEGTWVIVDNKQAREFEWRGGKVVKIPSQ